MAVTSFCTRFKYSVAEGIAKKITVSDTGSHKSAKPASVDELTASFAVCTHANNAVFAGPSAALCNSVVIIASLPSSSLSSAHDCSVKSTSVSCSSITLTFFTFFPFLRTATCCKGLGVLTDENGRKGQIKSVEINLILITLDK